MYRKSMREALEEARAYRDTTKDTTEGGPPTDGGPGSGAHNHKKPRNLTKTAKGIAFSPKYRGGDYTGAYKAINKIKKGLADRPAVARALKRANEELEEKSKYLRYSDLLIQKGRMQRAGDKQGERLTDIEIEKEKKKLGITDEFIPEGMMKRLIGAVQDKLSKEGGAAGFADLAKAAKSMGVTLTKDMLKDMPGVKQHRDGDYILEETELDEALEVKWDANKQGWFDKQGKRRYLGKFATSKLMSKAIDKAKASGDFITPFELKHGQKPEQVEEKTELNEAININIVKGMTQRNDHFGARLYIAEQMRDKEMMTIYQGLGLAHDNYNRYVGNSAVMVRQKLESALKVKIIGQYGRQKGAEIIKAL